MKKNINIGCDLDAKKNKPIRALKKMGTSLLLGETSKGQEQKILNAIRPKNNFYYINTMIKK